MFSKILNVNHPSLVSFPHLDILFSQKTVYPEQFYFKKASCLLKIFVLKMFVLKFSKSTRLIKKFPKMIIILLFLALQFNAFIYREMFSIRFILNLNFWFTFPKPQSSSSCGVARHRPPNACDNPSLEVENTIVTAPGCQEPIKTIWKLTPGCSLWRVVSISASPRFHQGLRDRPGGQYHTIKATQVAG